MFGEYTVLGGGTALAIPLDSFSARWTEDHAHTESPVEFFEFCKSLEFLNKESLDFCIEKRMTLDSNIPRGYGLGSSGAVTAACYAIAGSAEDKDIKSLLKKLAEMESYFHGKSSGLDPLCIYLDKAVLSNAYELSVMSRPVLPADLFILDSGKKRDSRKMIEVFYKKKADKRFELALEELNKLNENAISALTGGQSSDFKNHFKEISHLQWVNFREMIPENLKQTWKRGLDEESFYLKLSGAGGGGFFLGLGDIDDAPGCQYLS